MARRVINLLDPLRDYPDMMGVQDICELAGCGRTAASRFIRENGGVAINPGSGREVWKIHKEYVRKALNIPQCIA